MEPTNDFMTIDHCLHASIIGEQVKQEFFAFLEELPDELVAVTSFLSAPALALMTLITKVVNIVAIIWTAIQNIFLGFIRIDEDTHLLERALKQLVISLPVAIIDLLFIAPLHMFYNLTGDFLGLLTSPFSDYVSLRKTYHKDKIDELKGAIDHREHFIFLLEKAKKRGVPEDKFSPLIERWNDATDVKTLNEVKYELENLITSLQIASDSCRVFLASCNLNIYGNTYFLGDYARIELDIIDLEEEGSN